MANDWFDQYRFWLEINRDSEREQDKSAAKRTLIETFRNNAAYQPSALRNGISQPIIATRSNTRKCRITVLPGDSMCIGDLVRVFSEYWICMELYTDEYEITYGELWQCNQVFNYQDFDGRIIKKHAVIDDGSYSKGSDKAIPVANNTFICYVSIDEDSNALCIDKRLAIDTIFDASGTPIIDVGKICWIDSKSRNFGKGSHLLAFGLKDDLYNKERDDIGLMICDYNPITFETESKNNLSIDGRDTIRIGTGRTYRAYAIDESGNSVSEGISPKWSIKTPIDGVSLEDKGKDGAVLSVALSDALIGTIVTIVCIDESEVYLPAEKEIEVISIG